MSGFERRGPGPEVPEEIRERMAMFRGAAIWILEAYGAPVMTADNMSYEQAQWYNPATREGYMLTAPTKEVLHANTMPSVSLSVETKLPNGEASFLIHRLKLNSYEKKTEIYIGSSSSEVSAGTQESLQRGFYELPPLEGTPALTQEADLLLAILEQGMGILSDARKMA